MTSDTAPDAQHPIDGTRRLYGRAKGKALSTYQAGLIDTLLPELSLPKPPDGPLDWAKGGQPLRLEIGFGGGEHLLARARQNPAIQFIGIEPFINGVAKTLAGIDRGGLSNIRLHHGDARPVLASMPDGALSQIDILFPDPWPKPRHFKRRLLTSEFIAEIYRLLQTGGIFHFASDIITYVDWTLTRIVDHGGFIWEPTSASNWRIPPEGWPGTRYEAKAKREGRRCHYFEFVKQ